MTSRAKGNPMMANTRQVPGSPRSCRTPLSRSFPFFLGSLASPVPSEKSVQNPYKSDHFRICHFFSHCALTTYNFNALKCTDFPGDLNHARNLNLNPGCFSTSPVLASPQSPTFSLSHSLPATYVPLRAFPSSFLFARGNLIENTVHIRTNPYDFEISSDATALYQRLTPRAFRASGC